MLINPDKEKPIQSKQAAVANNMKEPKSFVVSELEGTLLTHPDPFSYFMLIAFEASGLIRFALLLFMWPIVKLLDAAGMGDSGLRLMVFVAVAGVRQKDVESVARAVLPKFFMDDIDVGAWRVFSSYDERVVVTQLPKTMVERFVKEHLKADEVVGRELVINRFGYATGFLRETDGCAADALSGRFESHQSHLGLCRSTSTSMFLACCKEVQNPPFLIAEADDDGHDIRPRPVIFHDGRLVPRPTPSMALLILLWIPIGILLAAIRITAGLIQPLWLIPYTAKIFGGAVIVKGRPPPPASTCNAGVLFVCTHRTLMDPVVLATVLGRQVPAVTYSISRLSEILSPIPTVRLTRDRKVDAERIREELSKGDLVVCPEGTTCREPFLLRFSALFAELTDRIVPVAMNYRVGFFHATTARGWKAMDPIFFFMNPRPIYEVTFLKQLPVEATCAAGKNPYDVANYVQRILAATLGFECTNFTRKDKYRVLAGNDGTVSAAATSYVDAMKKVAGALIH